MSGIIVGGLVLLLFLLVGWTWIRGTRAKAELAAKYPPPGQMVDVGGYRLHINCQGIPVSGSPTVVMEGGNAESCLTWALVQPEVARFARVCTYDRAGLGWSERSPQPRTATNIVEELHTLLTRAGVEPPYVLVGHSIGGMFVRLYAHRYPDQVTGMVLVDAAHEEQYMRFPTSLQRLQQQSLTMMAGVMRLLKTLNSMGLLALFADKIGRTWPTPIPDKVREAYLGVACSDTRFFEAAIDESVSVGENLVAVRAARIDTLGNLPLVVLSAPDQFANLEKHLSAEDAGQFRVVTEELQAELTALSSRGKRVIVRNSGHYIQVEQPEAVIDAIREVVEAAQR